MSEHLVSYLKTLSDNRVREIVERVAEYEENQRLCEDVASLRKLVAREAKAIGGSVPKELDSIVMLATYREAAMRFSRGEQAPKPREPEPGVVEMFSAPVIDLETHRDYVRDDIRELTGEEGREDFWESPDGKIIPFTAFEYELGHVGYTTYLLAFSLWPKSVKISLLASSASPDEHNPSVVTNVMHKTKVSYPTFGSADLWLSETRRLLDERLKAKS